MEKTTREAFIKAVENNSTTKQLREVADKYGYVCWDYPLVTEYGDIRVSIYPKDRSFRNFKPDFFLRTNFMYAHMREDSQYTYQWEMGTVSYGNLEWEDLENYVKGIMQAKALYDELVKIDLYGLERRPKEFAD